MIGRLTSGGIILKAKGGESGFVKRKKHELNAKKEQVCARRTSGNPKEQEKTHKEERKRG